MRCKSCNHPMSFGVVSINSNTQKEDDLCNMCVSKSMVEYSYFTDKIYQQDDQNLLGDPSKGCSGESNGGGYYYELFDNF